MIIFHGYATRNQKQAFLIPDSDFFLLNYSYLLGK